MIMETDSSLRYDIFELLCLVHHNNNKNNNNNNDILKQLPPIKEFRVNPGQSLKIPDIILFESRDEKYNNVKLPFYFPSRRREMFDAAKTIPKQLKKMFKTDDITTAHRRYLSALSILYTRYIFRLTKTQVKDARFAIRNALNQERELLVGDGEVIGGFTDYKQQLEESFPTILLHPK